MLMLQEVVGASTIGLRSISFLDPAPVDTVLHQMRLEEVATI